MEAPSRPGLAVPAGDSPIRSRRFREGPPAPQPSGRPAFRPRPRGADVRSLTVLLAALLAGLAADSAPSADLSPGYGPAGSGEEPVEVVLLAGGDVTLGARLGEHLRALAADDVTLDPHGYPFARIGHHLRAADLVLVNLEGPLTTRGRRIPKNFNFRADPSMVAALVRAGIGAVSLANNHVMDYGAVGMQDTLAVLQREGIVAFGAGMRLRAAREGAVAERRGMRIGFLGYLFMGNSLEPAEIFATAARPGVAGHARSEEALEAMVREDTGRLRPHVDVLVVSFHWGREKRYEPEPYQQRLGRATIDAGADVVVGHHPHVVQGIETYGGGLIAYSLGNFVFGGKWRPGDTDAILLKVRLRRPSPAGAARGRGAAVAGYEVIPLALGLYPHAPFQPVELTGEDADRVRAKANIPGCGVRVAACGPSTRQP